MGHKLELNLYIAAQHFISQRIKHGAGDMPPSERAGLSGG
jgi:hypothetical protein